MADWLRMSTPSTPSGFVRNLANPGVVTSIYTNDLGELGTWFQYQLVDSDGEEWRRGGIFTGASRASGATLALAWAGTELGKLPQASTLYIQARCLAYDSPARGWSDWSGGREIRTNAAPNIPTNLQPSTGHASSSRPLLSCQATDPDTWEDPPGSLTVYAEIMEDDGVTLKYRKQMAWNASTGQYEYQVASADEPGYRTFRWQALARDAGDLWSGGAETVDDATRSAAQTIVYAAAPSVTITGPASPTATASPEITWTTPDQASFTVTLTLPDGRIAYRTSRSEVDTRLWAIGAGGWQIPNGWRNGETATITIEVVNAAGVAGTAQKSLLLQYTKPGSATGFAAIPISLPGTIGPNGVELGWALSSIGAGTFHDYLIQRDQLTGQSGSVVSGTTVYVASVTNRSDLQMRDYTVASGTSYRFSIYQREKIGADVLWSDPVTFDIMVAWNGVVLHMLYAPEARCIELRHGAADASWEPAQSFGKSVTLYRTLGRSRRAARIAQSSELVMSHTFGLIDDPQTGLSSKEKRERILRIWGSQDAASDNRPHAICWRDGSGGSYSVVMGVFVTPPEITQDGSLRNVYAARLEMEEIDVTLGVEP